VLAFLRREEPAAKLARRYGVSEPTLYRYRDQFLEAGKSALADGRRGKADPRDQRIQRLEQDLARRDQGTDNGPSFTAKRFVRYTRDRFSHVRIAYRTPTQLGLLERFHRTLKQEEVYWRLYDSPSEAPACLAEFHARYNTRRPHWALIPETGGDPLTPEDVYVQGLSVRLPAWQPWAKQAKEHLDQMMLADAA